MEQVLTILFIAIIVLDVGACEITSGFAGLHVGDVMSAKWFAALVVLAVAAAAAIALLWPRPMSLRFPARDTYVIMAAILIVLSVMTCLPVKTSAVAAFWGAALAVTLGSGQSTTLPAALLSLLGAPLLGALLLAVAVPAFERLLYTRDCHLLVRNRYLKRAILVAVILLAMLLPLNYTRLFAPAFTVGGSLSLLNAAAAGAIALILTVSVARSVHRADDRPKHLRRQLPSVFSLAGVLAAATGAFAAVPVIVSPGQIRTFNNLLLNRGAAQDIADFLAITVATPLLAFVAAMALLAFSSHQLIIAVITVAVALICLMVHLYFNQYHKHSQTKRELRDEVSRRDEIGDELNRMDVAYVTSRFNAMGKEIDIKQKELIDLSLYIKQQRTYIEDTSRRLNDAANLDSADDMRASIQTIARELTENLRLSNEMDRVYTQVEAMHKNFVSRLLMRCPSLTEREKRLAILLRLGLSTKEIAGMLNIEPKSVEIGRYRFRQKLKIDRSVNLTQFLQLL